ncbi:MAG: hypothetical protein AAGB24_15895 [Bacteroidota bacterium]
MDKKDFGCIRSEHKNHMTTTMHVSGIDLNNIIEETETEDREENIVVSISKGNSQKDTERHYNVVCADQQKNCPYVDI